MVKPAANKDPNRINTLFDLYPSIEDLKAALPPSALTPGLPRVDIGATIEIPHLRSFSLQELAPAPAESR